MNIIDLTPEHEDLYCHCLEDWSEEMKEAGDHKARWLARMKERGLRVKLAVTDDGVYVDGRPLNSGPPLPYDKVRRRIEQQVRRVQR